jgi:hypothetical protein
MVRIHGAICIFFDKVGGILVVVVLSSCQMHRHNERGMTSSISLAAFIFIGGFIPQPRPLFAFLKQHSSGIFLSNLFFVIIIGCKRMAVSIYFCDDHIHVLLVGTLFSNDSYLLVVDAHGSFWRSTKRRH